MQLYHLYSIVIKHLYLLNYVDYKFELNQPYHIIIQQCLENGEFVYKIVINDEVILSAVNSNPLTFNLVKLYTSDPWYPPFVAEYGSLANFKVGICGRLNCNDEITLAVYFMFETFSGTKVFNFATQRFIVPHY